MSSYNFSLASSKDDYALRQRTKTDVMAGQISLSFQREPSYFSFLKNISKNFQVIKCQKNKQILASGTRAEVDCLLDGSVSKVGYLTDLRISKLHRNKTILKNGYAFLNSLHEKSKIDFYYSIIWSTNTSAKQILSTKRSNLPEYFFVNDIYCPVVFLNKKYQIRKRASLEFKIANRETIKRVVAFINSENKKNSLAHYLCYDSLINNQYQNLKIENFCYLVENGKIVSAIALWDQSAIRQVVIEAYNKKFAIISKLSNFVGLNYFPKINQEFKFVYGSFFSVVDNDLELAECMLRCFFNYIAEKKYKKVLLSISETSGLIDVVKQFRHLKFSGSLYYVFFNEREKEKYQSLLVNSSNFIEYALV